MQDLIRQHLVRSQQQMKRQADKNRSQRSFAVGDWVYLKLQPYVQSSVLPRANHKLSFKYFGPYQITATVGAVAYRLALPAASKIHPVVHVSQLKLAAGYKGPVPATLPTDLPEFAIPIQVLQTRGVTKGSRFVQQVLVEWSGLPRDLATWEDLEALRQCFPFVPAWGQVGLKGEGMLQPLYHRRSIHRSRPFVASLEEDCVVRTSDWRARSGSDLCVSVAWGCVPVVCASGCH
jgi:hypothetical protein